MKENRSLDDVFRRDGGFGGNGRGTAAIAPPLAHRPDVILGAATVRPSIRTVEGPGGSVTAEPRVMQVLLALADADGAVLTRDDLLEICWGGRVVGDDSINRAIAEARRIAQATQAGFVIETIPRIGYRMTVEASARPLETGETPESTTRPSRRGVILGMAGGAVAMLGGGFWWLARRPGLDQKTASLVSESEQALQLAMPDGDQRAIGLLEAAVQRRPEEASLWGKLALARARAQEHNVPTDPIKAVSATETAARRALILDPRNADAQAATAILLPYYGDWLAAERRFDAVLAIDPAHGVTRDARAFLLNAVGRTSEGSRDRVALSRDHPLDAGIQFRLIYALWMLGRIEEADRVANRAMELWPRHFGVWLGQLWILACTGRLERALLHIEDAAARPPFPPPMIETLALSVRAALSGQPAAKAAATDRIMAQAVRSPEAVVSAMMLLNLLGALDQAFALADAYYLERGPILAAMRPPPGKPVINDQRRRKTNMLFVPVAQRMREDPRFQPLMEAMGLADYWRRRGVVPDYQKRNA
jgi:DNA-binding winged helix-turn-helix (wHTH) protein/tetratricopeptide (TPR) repeat protein